MWTVAHTRARVAALIERAKAVRTEAEAPDPVASVNGVLVFLGDLCRRLDPHERQPPVQQATLTLNDTVIPLVVNGQLQFRSPVGEGGPMLFPGFARLTLPTLSPPLVFDLTHALGQVALLQTEIDVSLEVDGARSSLLLNRELAQPHLSVPQSSSTTELLPNTMDET